MQLKATIIFKEPSIPPVTVSIKPQELQELGYQHNYQNHR